MDFEEGFERSTTGASHSNPSYKKKDRIQSDRLINCILFSAAVTWVLKTTADKIVVNICLENVNEAFESEG